MIEENETGKVKGNKAHRWFSKMNDFMSVEFFCNFLMAIQLDVLLGACLAIQNASFNSVLRIADTVLAVVMLLCYLSFLLFIVVMTKKILRSDGDKLLSTHYNTKYRNWLFIIEPLIEWKNERKESENGTTHSTCLDDSVNLQLKKISQKGEKPSGQK